jgi:hypothetical protein
MILHHHHLLHQRHLMRCNHLLHHRLLELLLTH